MLTIVRQKDNRVVRAFTHRLADIPNGVNVSSSEFTQSVLKEGTPVGKDATTGLYHPVKVAILTAAAAATDTAYTVAKGHNFKVGDFIMLKPAGKAYAITAIATNATDAKSDDITVGTTLGAAAAIGDGIYQAAAQAATNVSAFKYQPISNLLVIVVTIGQVREALIPALGAEVKAKLPLIKFI
jgi:hypothetical protein